MNDLILIAAVIGKIAYFQIPALVLFLIGFSIVWILRILKEANERDEQERRHWIAVQKAKEDWARDKQ